MRPEDKKYISENFGKKSIKQMAQDIHVKERKIRLFLEKEGQGRPQIKKETVSAQSEKQFQQLLVAAALVIAGFMIYSNTLRSSFHWDDISVIIRNTSIRNPSNFSAIVNAFNTRFMVGLSLAFNYAIGKVNVLGYHIFNIAVHVASAVMIYLLVNITFKTPRMRGSALVNHRKIIALFSALLFLVHPIQSQAVDYIWQRAASMAAFFYLASIFFYAKARSGSSYLYYAASLIATVLGMFSKETTVTIPFAIVAYEFIFFDRANGEIKKVFITLLVFCLTLPIIPLMFTRANKITLDVMRPPTIQALHSNTPGARESANITSWVTEDVMSRQTYILTQFNVIRTYLRLIFLPIHQNLDYDYPLTHTIDVGVLFSLLLIALIIFLAIKIFSVNRLVSYGIFWFFLTLSVESLVVQNDVIFEHRMYLPMVGLALVISNVMFLILKDLKKFITVMCVITLILSLVTYRRNNVWKDEISLWKDVVAKSPNKPRGWYNLTRFMGESDPAHANEYYEKAIRFKPHSVEEYNDLATIYWHMGKTEEAMELYGKVLQRRPDDAKALSNLANIYLDKGVYEKAIEMYKKSIDINPTLPEVYNNLGKAYHLIGNDPEAIRLIEKAIELNPNDADARYNLDQLQGRQGVPVKVKGNPSAESE